MSLNDSQDKHGLFL